MIAFTPGGEGGEGRNDDESAEGRREDNDGSHDDGGEGADDWELPIVFFLASRAISWVARLRRKVLSFLWNDSSYVVAVDCHSSTLPCL